LLQKHLEQAFDRPHHPHYKLDTPPAINPEGNTITNSVSVALRGSAVSGPQRCRYGTHWIRDLPTAVSNNGIDAVGQWSRVLDNSRCH